MDPLGRRRFATLALCGVGAALSGCAAFELGGPPPQLYTLSPKSTFDPDLPNVTWQLLIQSPTAPAGLNSVRIALRETPFTLNYYAGVAWTDRAPQMVQTLLLESFENSGRIVSVDRQALGLRANYVVLPELREFQAEYLESGAPRVRIAVAVRLVRVPERVIIASNSFNYLAVAADERFESIMSAFDEALGKIMRDIVEWTLRVGEEDWRNLPSNGTARADGTAATGVLRTPAARRPA